MSTPLNQLPSLAPNMPDQNMPPMNPQNHDQLVDDILRDIEEPPQQQSNIDTEMLGYSMDSSQIPPPKMNKNFLDASSSKSSGNDVESDNSNDGGFMDYTETKMEWIMNMVKAPLVVFVITFILSLPHFNRFLFGLIPSCLLESGQVNIYGVLLKAVIGAVLFIVISLLV
jgi:hypothetical protein